jgi:hypothetical protein
LTVKGSLYLSNTQITSLPDNLTVDGYLDLENTQITSLPDNLTVNGSLNLNNTLITSLPDNLRVEGKIIGLKLWLKNHHIEKYEILDNGQVIVYQKDYYPHASFEGFPDYFVINKWVGNLSMTYLNHLETTNLPKLITGNLYFYGNNLKLKQLPGDVTVLGETFLKSPQQIAQKEYNKTYRGRGPIKNRKQHEFEKDVTTSYSRGYKTYQALKYIRDAGPLGVPRIKITELLYDMTHGIGSFNKKENYSWGSTGYFGAGANMRYYKVPEGTIHANTDRLPNRNYVINQQGLDTIERYKKLFKE